MSNLRFHRPSTSQIFLEFQFIIKNTNSFRTSQKFQQNFAFCRFEYAFRELGPGEASLSGKGTNQTTYSPHITRTFIIRENKCKTEKKCEKENSRFLFANSFFSGHKNQKRSKKFPENGKVRRGVCCSSRACTGVGHN